MSIRVDLTGDPARVLEEARAFLAGEPVLHNLILTLLETRVQHPEPGRYWIASDEGAVLGVTFQSPLTFPAVITPMRSEAVEATVDAIAEAGVALPGVVGEASAAARFAGQWTERHDSAAIPFEGQRLYELIEPVNVPAASGRLRRAGREDRDLLVSWMRDFHAEISALPGSPEELVDRRPFYLWEDGERVSTVAHTEPVAGVVRVQFVFTPKERRRRGYAGACVAELSKRLRASGYRCALYTDLGNPSSNSIYRRIGYRAIAEALRYRFE